MSSKKHLCVYIHLAVQIYSLSKGQEFAELQMQLFGATYYNFVKAALNLLSPASWKFPQKNIVPDILSANYIINSFIIKTAISVPSARSHILLNRHITLTLAVSVLVLIFITVQSLHTPWKCKCLRN